MIVLIVEHPATVKTLNHLSLFFERPQDIDYFPTVSTATQNPMSVKEPILCEYSKTFFPVDIFA